MFRIALAYRSVCSSVVEGRAFVAGDFVDNVGREERVVCVLVRMSRKLVPLECVTLMSWEERIF